MIVDNNFLIFKCPHCEQYILVHQNEINCKIFRHAVYKHNLLPINPHSSKKVCEKLLQKNKIYGCGKPFRLVENDGNFIVEICEYI